MTTALLSPARVRVPQSAPRLLTFADLAALPTSLPTGDVKYELDDGALVVMSPPGGIHARKQGKAIVILGHHAEAKGLGEYRGEAMVVLRRNPDRAVAPDAMFHTTDQLPVKHSKEGYLETIPKLVVAVRSKNDTWPEVESKAAEYLAAGVERVWVVDDAKKMITAFGSGVATQVFAAADILTAPFLPGFAVPVADFFA